MEGLDQNLNSSLPFRQAVLKFCLPLASLGQYFFYLFGRRLPWALPIWASKTETLLARQ